MVVRRYEIYLQVFKSIGISVLSTKKKFHIYNYVVFCLLYKPTNYDVFDDFPKISEDFQNVVQRSYILPSTLDILPSTLDKNLHA